MADPKFTKGPWVAHLGETYRVHDKSNQTVAWATFVFSTETQTGRRPTDTVAANTHLIAAAPELYESLEGIIQFCSDSFAGRVDGSTDEAWWRDGYQEIIKRCRSSLAKARGETS